MRAVKCAPCILPLPPPQVFCVPGVTHGHLPPPWAVTHRVWAKWRLMIGKEEELYGGGFRALELAFNLHLHPVFFPCP